MNCRGKLELTPPLNFVTTLPCKKQVFNKSSISSGRRWLGAQKFRPLQPNLWRSRQVIGSDAVRSSRYDFRLAIRRTMGLRCTVCNIHDDIGRQSQIFVYFAVYSTFPSEFFSADSAQREPEWCARLYQGWMSEYSLLSALQHTQGYRVMKDAYNRFEQNTECDGKPDIIQDQFHLGPLAVLLLL